MLKSHLTITADIYIQQLQRVNEKLHEMRPALVNCQNVILLDDNVRPHTESVTQETIFKLQCFILPHQPYSLDLAPTYYQVFCSLQNLKNFSSEEVVNTISAISKYNTIFRCT